MVHRSSGCWSPPLTSTATATRRSLIGTGVALVVVLGLGWTPFTLRALADYHEWAGRDALRRGDSILVAQREWQHSLALYPANTAVRLELARSYLDQQWYGGAQAQARAALAARHT